MYGIDSINPYLGNIQNCVYGLRFFIIINYLCKGLIKNEKYIHSFIYKLYSNKFESKFKKWIVLKVNQSRVY